MEMARYLGCFLSLFVFVSSPAYAQTCLGRVSFTDRPASVSFGGAFSGDARAMELGVLGGGVKGFGGVGLALVVVSNHVVHCSALGSRAVGGRYPKLVWGRSVL